jgi:hypothetical protein
MEMPRGARMRCRVCGAPVSPEAPWCPSCGSRRPFACALCGKMVEAPLNPPQLLGDGGVACIRHAPWARCSACDRVGTYMEVTTTGWVYLGDRSAVWLLRRYPRVAARALRVRATQRWLCPRCNGVYRQECQSGKACLAAGAAALWAALRDALTRT